MIHDADTPEEEEVVDYLKRVAQEAFEEKIGDRQMFMREFGRNYL